MFLLRIISIFSIFCLWISAARSQEATQSVTRTVRASDLAEYHTLSVETQQLIDHALGLAGRGLGYQYGSARPDRGGMDCSGAIHYLLKDLMGIEGVPRQANHFYRWVWRSSTFHAVNSSRAGGFEWAHLEPGNLLFWSGTYEVDRDPPVTHVMLYLGTLKDSGKPVMFGASSGRRFAGESMHGISVFDFVLPSSESTSRFLGYGSVPNLTSPGHK